MIRRAFSMFSKHSTTLFTPSTIHNCSNVFQHHDHYDSQVSHYSSKRRQVRDEQLYKLNCAQGMNVDEDVACTSPAKKQKVCTATRKNFTPKQKQQFFNVRCKRLTIPNEKEWNPKVLELFHSLFRLDSYGSVIISPSEGVTRKCIFAAEGDHIDAKKRHENKFDNLDLIQWYINLCKGNKSMVFALNRYLRLVQEGRVFTEYQFLNRFFTQPPKDVASFGLLVGRLKRIERDDEGTVMSGQLIKEQRNLQKKER